MIFLTIIAIVLGAFLLGSWLDVSEGINLTALTRHKKRLEHNIDWLSRFANDLTVREILWKLEKELKEINEQIEGATKC